MGIWAKCKNRIVKIGTEDGCVASRLNRVLQYYKNYKLVTEGSRFNQGECETILALCKFFEDSAQPSVKIYFKDFIPFLEYAKHNRGFRVM